MVGPLFFGNYFNFYFELMIHALWMILRCILEIDLGQVCGLDEGFYFSFISILKSAINVVMA